MDSKTNIENINIFDQSVRRKILADPKAYFQQEGADLSDDVKVTVFKNTKDTFYFVMPSSKILNINLKDINAAALAVSTAGTAASASTLSSIGSCAGCFATLGTVGSVKN